MSAAVASNNRIDATSVGMPMAMIRLVNAVTNSTSVKVNPRLEDVGVAWVAVMVILPENQGALRK